MRVFAAALLLCLSTPALACSGPTCCGVHGVQAVCRSPVVEAQAKETVLRRCLHCPTSDVADWIFSYQMNRGPYASAADLARDVLSAMHKRSATIARR